MTTQQVDRRHMWRQVEMDTNRHRCARCQCEREKKDIGRAQRRAFYRPVGVRGWVDACPAECSAPCRPCA